MTELLVVLSHPDTLASGRPIAPGDQIPQNALNPDDLHDANLIVAGAFLALGPQRKDKPRAIAEVDKSITEVAAKTVSEAEDRHATERAAEAAAERAAWTTDPDNPDAAAPDEPEEK